MINYARLLYNFFFERFIITYCINICLCVLQIDVLEDPVIRNVIILQTVLQEVRHRSAPVYKRVKDMIHEKEKHFYTFTNEHHRYKKKTALFFLNHYSIIGRSQKNTPADVNYATRYHSSFLYLKSWDHAFK